MIIYDPSQIVTLNDSNLEYHIHLNRYTEFR